MHSIQIRAPPTTTCLLHIAANTSQEPQHIHIVTLTEQKDYHMHTAVLDTNRLKAQQIRQETCHRKRDQTIYTAPYPMPDVLRFHPINQRAARTRCSLQEQPNEEGQWKAKEMNTQRPQLTNKSKPYRSERARARTIHVSPRASLRASFAASLALLLFCPAGAIWCGVHGVWMLRCCLS